MVTKGRAPLNNSAAFSIQFDNTKNYQKLMYDLMSPPGIKKVEDTTYKNAFS